MRPSLLILSSILLLLPGCVERTLTVRSEPEGALLYLNGNEVGRTPYTAEFTWYGTYDVELRKENYQTLKTTGPVIAPWWQWVPFDLVADLVPVRLHDRQWLSYSLRPASAQADDPAGLMNRAENMRPQLQSSPHAPATRPAK